VSWRGSLGAAFLATLSHPRWWVLSLAGFLIRGGVVLLLVPIIVPPTVAGLMSLVAPTIIGAVLVGGPNTPVGLVALVTALVLFGWLAIAGTIGTWFEAALVAEAAGDEDLGLGVAVRRLVPSGLGTARLLPHVLTAVVFIVAAAQIFAVIYAEATTPGAPTTPFVIRVISQTPGQLVALVLAWLLAEAVGGLAVRELLLDRGADPGGVRGAIGRGARDLLRSRALATFLLVNLATVVIAAPGWLAAGRAWAQLRLLFTDGADATGLAIGLLLFVGVVIGWLTLLGVALAWRSTAWTAVAAVPAGTAREVVAPA
jgi:hypothetical protein